MSVIVINSKKYGKHKVLFSEEDSKLVESRKWFIVFNKTRNSFVPTTNDYTTKPCKHPSMSRLIMGEPKNMHINHINHDTLDNRRENLRIATPQENAKNKNTYKNNKSTGYKGVYKRVYKKRNLYEVYIQSNKIRQYVGSYKNINHALIAYNLKAKELHGEFACLHQVDMTKTPIPYNRNKSTGVKNITFLRGHYQVVYKRKYLGFFKTLEEAKQKLEETQTLRVLGF